MTKVDVNAAFKPPFAARYDNFIGGKWVAPNAGKYFDNISPITGQVMCADRALRRIRHRGSRSTPPTPPRTPGAHQRPPSAR